jgi:hypothetical protein
LVDAEGVANAANEFERGCSVRDGAQPLPVTGVRRRDPASTIADDPGKFPEQTVGKIAENCWYCAPNSGFQPLFNLENLENSQLFAANP